MTEKQSKSGKKRMLPTGVMLKSFRDQVYGITRLL